MSDTDTPDIETREKMAKHRDVLAKRHRTPTDKQQAFLDNYILLSRDVSFDTYSEMILTAFKNAGYDATNKNAMTRAKGILERYWHLVEQGLSLKLKMGAVLAADVLIELCTTAKQDSVRLKAATELLNKAGYKETDKLELSERPADEMTHEERQAEIRALMGKQGLKAVVGSDVQVQDTEEV